MGVRIRRGFDEVGTWETTSSFYLLPALSHPSSASSSSVVVSHPLLPTAIATLPTGTRTTGRQMWTRMSLAQDSLAASLVDNSHTVAAAATTLRPSTTRTPGGASATTASPSATRTGTHTGRARGGT